jgi:hypothetical protein
MEKWKRMEFIQVKLYVRQTKNDRSIHLYQLYVHCAKKVSCEFEAKFHIIYLMFTI